ncbi:hypothetical protein VTK56DRAFT_8324 [Thermocarpiscus australiensis]
MADSVRHDQESMYCHACHNQWHREGERIECPACRSTSTEIITPENDPRDFHNRRPEQSTAAPVADPAPGGPEPVTTRQGTEGASMSTAAPHNPSGNDAHIAGGDSDSAHNSGANSTRGPPPRVTFRVAVPDVPHVTVLTFVTGHVPPQATQDTPAVTFFGLQFFPPFHPPAPPPTRNNSVPSEADGAGPQNQQADGQQQPPPPQQSPPPQTGPQPATTAHPVMPAGLLATILASLFSPANAIFGDAVYSQEAFDRVMTQLREQMQPGGAPPASQAAIDKLQTRELDDALLGGCADGKGKCVICVDDMVRGDHAAVLPCSHFFHGDCVTPWLKLHNTCPVCRRPIEEEDKVKAAKNVDNAANLAPESAAGAQAPEPMDCS